MDSFDDITCEEEYEALFPFEQEYQAWVNAIEKDFIDEVNYRAGIASQQDRDNFIYVYDDELEDELSPFATVNS